MSALDGVMVKVRALRALAARAGTAHEAETAAAQADALIQKHRLDEADIEASGAVAAEAIGDGGDLWSGTRKEPWIARLGAVLGKHYGCAVYNSRESLFGRTVRVSLCVVGRPSDVAIVRFMFAWISSEIVRLARGQRGRVAFAHGAVSGVRTALEASALDAVHEHSEAHGGGAAMVLASRHEAAMAWARTALDVGAARPVRGPTDADAYLRGVEAGRQIDVSGKVLDAGADARALPESAS